MSELSDKKIEEMIREDKVPDRKEPSKEQIIAFAERHGHKVTKSWKKQFIVAYLRDAMKFKKAGAAEGEDEKGTLVCHLDKKGKVVAYDVSTGKKKKFPIEKIVPIEEFNNDDMESVRQNNTSCFNFRYVIGSNKLSDHSTGNAIDINPMQNPWIHPSAHKIPNREYIPGKKGTITNEVVEIFKSYGWNWGGNWRNPDYQHFFKPDNKLKEEVLSISESIILKYSDFIVSL